MESCFKCGKEPQSNQPLSNLDLFPICLSDENGEEKDFEIGLCFNCARDLLERAGAECCDKCGDMRFDVRPIETIPAVSHGDPDSWSPAEHVGRCHACHPEE